MSTTDVADVAAEPEPPGAEFIAEREHARVRAPSARTRSSTARRRWMFALAALVAWAIIDAGVSVDSIVNPAGWTLADRFVSAAWNPELDPAFLEVVVAASGVTIAYAVLGTVFALVVGLVGGVLSSETWWRRDPLTRGPRRSTRRGWLITRGIAVVPRGLHEAIWALVLLAVLGRNPLVAILAIGIPFGAVTAKVFAEMIDDASAESFDALRMAGAGRSAAMLYGTFPVISGGMVAYGYYRFECAMRSSVVLGMIGAGGLGFQLVVSFQSLRYREIWTIVITIVLLAALTDAWSSAVRHRRRSWIVPLTAAVGVSAAVVSWWRLGVDPTTLFDERARRLTSDLASSAWPPRLPAGGWSELIAAAIDTIQLSVIAIALATLFAVPLAFVIARTKGDSTLVRSRRYLVRSVVLVVRCIPPPVWALVVLFVMYPGPLAGGVALGVYTFGVLCRLDADAVESADRTIPIALVTAGSPGLSARLYGDVPQVAPRFAALTMYRWEVALRETVIVGLVGAGGIGRLISQQNAAFDRAGMLVSLVVLILLALVVDIVSSRVRASLR